MTARRKATKHHRRRPRTSDALDTAIQLHQAGKLVEAEQAYRRALKAEPKAVQPVYLLGVVAQQLGRPNDAIKRFQRAVELQPDHVGAISELAKLLQEAGRLEESAEALRKLIALRPELGDLYNNLGVVLRRLGKPDEATNAYLKAVKLSPDHAETHYNLGSVLRDLERPHEAAAAYRQAISLNPRLPDAHRALASVLRHSGKLDEAAMVLKEWLTNDPNNPVARHMVSALSGEDTPVRASDDYVRSVFDKFATTYDDDLRQLGYQGPQLIAEAVLEELGAREYELVVLDAGCGTGLCGPSLRPISRQLVGVDLSTEMIDHARELKLYDEVVAGELTDYLIHHTNSFDLIVAADTFNYFGALEPLLTAAANALRPKGLLIFTLEQAGASAPVADYCLHPHGRYSHTEEYVRRCAMGCNLTTHSMESVTLRTERGQPVIGLLVRALRFQP